MMPKYRQLHTKILDSYDFAEMPDDFTRLFWILLIVVVDSEGRAMDNAEWLRSRVFPLRSDVQSKNIDKAMSWLSDRGMIIRYIVDGRNYFYIDKFKEYQSGTDKEGKSYLPSPDKVRSNGGVTTELPRPPVSVNESESVSVNESGKKEILNFPDNLNTDNFKDIWNRWLIFRCEIKHKITPSIQQAQFKMLSKYSEPVAIRMIENSITNGWQGLFEIKGNIKVNNNHEATKNILMKNLREIESRENDN
jgi:hypothetical protein